MYKTLIHIFNELINSSHCFKITIQSFFGVEFEFHSSLFGTSSGQGHQFMIQINKERLDLSSTLALDQTSIDLLNLT